VLADIYTAIKTTNEFRNVSVTQVGVAGWAKAFQECFTDSVVAVAGWACWVWSTYA